jgi:hypothetical protein
MASQSSPRIYSQALDSGSARAILAIEDHTQPSSYSFGLSLPDGLVPELQADGGVRFTVAPEVEAAFAAPGLASEFDFGGVKAP